jgi:hypothetical protein
MLWGCLQPWRNANGIDYQIARTLAGGVSILQSRGREIAFVAMIDCQGFEEFILGNLLK